MAIKKGDHVRIVSPYNGKVIHECVEVGDIQTNWLTGETTGVSFGFKGGVAFFDMEHVHKIDTVKLDQQAWDKLTELTENPPEPTEALRKLMKGE